MLKSSKEYQCAYAIITNISKELGISLMNEIFYLSQHLIASQKFFIENVDDDYQYKDIVIHILEEIKETMHIDLADDLQLINGLAMHLNTAMQRVHFDMNIRNEFIDILKNSYPLAFELATIAGRTIEKSYALLLREAEIGFLTIHFGASLERKGFHNDVQPQQSHPRIKVALVCIAGVAMALLLKEKLIRKFGDVLEIVRTSPAQQVDEALLNAVDLILTTVDLSNLNSKFQYRFQYQLFFSRLNIAGFSFCSFHFFVPFLTRIFSSLLESHCAEAALLPPLLPSSPSRTQTVLCPLVHQEAPVLRPLPVLPSPQPSFDFFLFVRQFQKTLSQPVLDKLRSQKSLHRKVLCEDFWKN